MTSEHNNSQNVLNLFRHTESFKKAMPAEMIQILSRTKRCNRQLQQPQSQPEVKCTPILGVGPELKHRDQPDTASNMYMLFKNIVIPNNMQIKQVSAYMDRTTPFQLVMYRGSVGALSIVGRSQVFTPSGLGIGNFNLNTPISVQTGDIVGIYYPAVGGISMERYSSGEPWGMGNTSGSVLYSGDATKFGSSTNRWYSIKVGGESCVGSVQSQPEVKQSQPEKKCTPILGVGPELKHRDQPDTASNMYMLFKNIVIPNNMQIKQVSAYMDRTTPFQLVMYRGSVGALSIVGRSQVFTPSGLGIGNFNLNTPISVQTGDIVGIYYPAVGGISMERYSSGEPWGMGNTSGSVLYSGDATKFGSSTNRWYSIKVGGESC